MSPITTHVLDIAKGRPARSVAVRLERRAGRSWRALGRGRTDADGRLGTLLPAGAPLVRGTYRLTFATGRYLGRGGPKPFYPEVAIVFEVRDAAQHYHVPLLLSPFGYSTYRGS